MKPGVWILALGMAAAFGAHASACPHRGDLDARYCDANRDMVADAPTDPRQWRDPGTLTFAYSPSQDPAELADMLKPLVDHLARCTGKPVNLVQYQNNTAQLDALRAGELHVANFSTGATVLAVNKAGAVPFTLNGDANGFRGYHLITIVKANGPLRALKQLKGQRVAHTAPSSHSGHLAPMALLPAQGLVPGKDYEIRYSGRHEASILGVAAGDFDAAHVASAVLERMGRSGRVQVDGFRTLYRSPRFPSSAYTHAHDLKPALAARLVACFADFRFPPRMAGFFEGADRFVPLNYVTDWAVIRDTEPTPAPKRADTPAR